MKTAFPFFGLIMVVITVFLECDAMILPYNGEENETEAILIRQKRLAPLAIALIGALAGASAAFGFKALDPPSSKSCNIGISTDESRGKLLMNFVTVGAEENCNLEILGGRDSTNERVDGGRLQYITFEILGSACLEYLGIICGGDVTGKGQRSIILSHESFPSYHCMMHKKWKTDPCVWIHEINKDNIRNFFINTDIFNCDESDTNCHRNNIGTQVGGCVDMTQCKFCNDRCGSDRKTANRWGDYGGRIRCYGGFGYGRICGVAEGGVIYTGTKKGNATGHF